MPGLPRAPFVENHFSSDNVVAPKPAQRTAQQIVDLALEKLAPEIEKHRYKGHAMVELEVQEGDPEQMDIHDTYIEAVNPLGYMVDFWTEGPIHHFDLSWDTPYTRLCDIIADDKCSYEGNFEAIAAFISRGDPNFEKVQDGLWKLDLVGYLYGEALPSLDTTESLLTKHGIRAFFHGAYLCVFSDRDLSIPSS